VPVVQEIHPSNALAGALGDHARSVFVQQLRQEGCFYGQFTGHIVDHQINTGHFAQHQQEILLSAPLDSAVKTKSLNIKIKLHNLSILFESFQDFRLLCFRSLGSLFKHPLGDSSFCFGQRHSMGSRLDFHSRDFFPVGASPLYRVQSNQALLLWQILAVPVPL